MSVAEIGRPGRLGGCACGGAAPAESLKSLCQAPGLPSSTEVARDRSTERSRTCPFTIGRAFGHGTFHHFHHLWVGEISKALNSGILPPDYYAYAEQVAGDFGPDVLTLQEAPPRDRDEDRAAPAGALALADAPPKVRLAMDLELSRYTRRQRGVILRHSSDDRVIAIIEVISPGNKASRNNFRTFIEKACAALTHGVHLLLSTCCRRRRATRKGFTGPCWKSWKELTMRPHPTSR